jgi:hypothetical protein
MSDYHSIDRYFVLLYILNVCDGKCVKLFKFASCFTCGSRLVSHSEGGTEIEVI